MSILSNKEVVSETRDKFNLFRATTLVFFLTGCFLFTGCLSFSAKQAETLSKGVYAVGESIDKGRIDLAEQYNKEVQAYFPNPKKPIKIVAVTPKNQPPVVVLPKSLVGKRVVVVSTVEWQKLVDENPLLKKQLGDEQTSTKKYKAEVAQLKNDQLEEAKRVGELEDYKSSNQWFWRILGFFGIGLPTFVVVALIAVAIFFPAALPLVIVILTRVFSGVAQVGRSVVGFVVSTFNKLFKFIQSKQK